MNPLYLGKFVQCYYLTFESTGLGLTTVSHIVQAMKGRISVESKVGEGSKFSVVLPLKLVSQFPPCQNSVNINENGSNNVTSKTIRQRMSRVNSQIQIQKKYLSLLSTPSPQNNFGNSDIIVADGKYFHFVISYTCQITHSTERYVHKY